MRAGVVRPVCGRGRGKMAKKRHGRRKTRNVAGIYPTGTGFFGAAGGGGVVFGPSVAGGGFAGSPGPAPHGHGRSLATAWRMALGGGGGALRHRGDGVPRDGPRCLSISPENRKNEYVILICKNNSLHRLIAAVRSRCPVSRTGLRQTSKKAHPVCPRRSGRESGRYAPHTPPGCPRQARPIALARAKPVPMAGFAGYIRHTMSFLGNLRRLRPPGSVSPPGSAQTKQIQ